jgi:hypothetical protein
MTLIYPGRKPGRVLLAGSLKKFFPGTILLFLWHTLAETPRCNFELWEAASSAMVTALPRLSRRSRDTDY